MPHPEASPAPTSLEDLKSDFAFFDDWEEKYRYIIDLGRDLPQFEEDYRTEEALVRGCQSQVWLYCWRNEENQQLQLAIDSDAHIVRGLIGVVLAAYADKTADEVLAFDIEKLFSDLDLLAHLSPTRGNGLRAMVKRIRENCQSV